MGRSIIGHIHKHNYQINETLEKYRVFKDSPSRPSALRRLLHKTQNKTPSKKA